MKPLNSLIQKGLMAKRPQGDPGTSDWTSRDITIIPATSCCWPLSSHRLDAKALLHRFMPGSAAVCTDVVGRVNALASGSTPT